MSFINLITLPYPVVVNARVCLNLASDGHGTGTLTEVAGFPETEVQLFSDWPV